MIAKIGNYELGENIDTLSLKEVSKDEFAGRFKNQHNWMKSKAEQNFSIEDYKKNFKFDKVYENEKFQFLGVDWGIQIFTVEDKILSITVEHWTSSKQEVEFIFKKVYQHITENMGKYTKHRFLSKTFAWEWEEEDVILAQSSLYRKYFVCLSLTKKVSVLSSGR